MCREPGIYAESVGAYKCKPHVELLKIARAEEHELVTMIHGDELNPAQANQIADSVRKAYPQLEIEIQNGGQPNYPFILSIE